MNGVLIPIKFRRFQSEFILQNQFLRTNFHTVSPHFLLRMYLEPALVSAGSVDGKRPGALVGAPNIGDSGSRMAEATRKEGRRSAAFHR
jgi:hypothetical protein